MGSTDRPQVPAAVRRRLRQEVGFGCPVDGCGSPYLSWHHFDPPWREGHTHEPEGMVALCLHHHKQADIGTFESRQLRRLKEDPYLLRTGSPPRGQLSWRREALVLCAGSNWFTRCRLFLRAAGVPLIWSRPDADGYELLNLDVFNGDGTPLFQMRDNDWVITPIGVSEVDCPPAGRSLLLRAGDVRLELNFKAMSKADVRERFLDQRLEAMAQLGVDAEQLESTRIMGETTADMFFSSTPDAEVTLVTLEGELVHPVPVRLTERATHVAGSTIMSSAAGHSEIGLDLPAAGGFGLGGRHVV